MEAACLRHTNLPNHSRLFADFIYHHDRVSKYYEVRSSAHTANTGSYPAERRAALAEALREQNGASASLDLLSQEGTAAVVTGQQVGLFSGPSYTIYKALTAVRQVERLKEQGIPAVPVFWLATEDHDFAEVNHSWSFDHAHRPRLLQVDGHPGADQPVGSIRLDQWPIAELRSSFSNLPFADETARLAADAYIPGASMGEGFQALLRRLLEPFGFLFLDPIQPSVRRLAAPLLENAIADGPELSELLLNRNRDLESAGYHAQVHVEAKTSLVFLLEGERRVALRRQNGDYYSKDNRYTAGQLAGHAAHLSPNALLRPVVQDYILPTAAYIGGPAELAYFAQSQVLYERLLGYMPQLVSRSGFTLFDGRSVKLMDRYRLRLQDFFHGEEALRERIARSLVPPALEQEFSAADRSINETLSRLDSALQQFDPTLRDALGKSRAKMLHQLSKMEAKAAREIMRRNDRAREEAEYLYNGLFPNKHLQERTYSILPFLARHGLDLIDRLYENVRLDCPDHLLLPV